MCRAATCRKCGLATWKGCGAHVDQVLRGVPTSGRCQCGSGKTTTTKQRKSWFSR